MTTFGDMLFQFGGVPVFPFMTGSVWFVHSGTGVDDLAHGQNPTSPLATIDYAVGRCTASKDDVILVMPGHAETISGATSLVIDVAGIRIIGLGFGTLKPVLTFSATASIIDWTAANCWLENVRLLGNVDNIVTGISLGATADGAVIKNVEIVDGASNKEFLIDVAIAAACHDVTIDGLVVHGLGGGATACISLAGASDRLAIRNCRVNGTFSTALLNLASACADIAIHDNFLCNEDVAAGLVYKGHASSTGFLCRNFLLGTKNNTETANTVTAIHCAENYGTDTVATSGILTPSTLTAWA